MQHAADGFPLPDELLIHLFSFLQAADAACAILAAPFLVRARIDSERFADVLAERLVLTHFPTFPQHLVAGSCPLHKAAIILGQLGGDPHWMLTSTRRQPPAWFFRHLVGAVIDCGYDLVADVRALVKLYCVFGEPYEDPSRPFGEPAWSPEGYQTGCLCVVPGSTLRSDLEPDQQEAHDSYISGIQHLARLCVSVTSSIRRVPNGHVCEETADRVLTAYFTSHHELACNTLLPDEDAEDEADEDDASYASDDGDSEVSEEMEEDADEDEDDEDEPDEHVYCRNPMCCHCACNCRVLRHPENVGNGRIWTVHEDAESHIFQNFNGAGAEQGLIEFVNRFGHGGTAAEVPCSRQNDFA
jgi:hypothetical protein